MTKLRQKISKSKTPQKRVEFNSISCKSDTPSLDTLAQLANNNKSDCKCLKNSELPNTLKSLGKRAKAKHISDPITLKLVDITKSKYDKQPFWNTWHCARKLQQSEGKVTTKYCKNRWCIVCNRIRTAKLILGYGDELKKLKNPYFVTLTVRNISAKKLSSEIDKMFLVFTKIRKNFSYYKHPLIGIRKLESTVSERYKNHHPHFHLIIDGKENAELLVDEWLKRYKGTDRDGQDCKKADPNSMIELFKYFTKMFTKDGVYTKDLKVIINALKGRRVIQALGISQIKESDEDVEDIKELESQLYKELDADDRVTWDWNGYDWINQETGEFLTGYVPDDEALNLTKLIF